MTNSQQIIGPFGARLIYAAGRLYSTAGQIFDTNSYEEIASVPDQGLVIPDPAQERVYFLNGTVFTAFDLNTLLPLGSLNLPNASGTPGSFVQTGSDTFAIATGTQIHHLDTTALYTNGFADLGVTVGVSPAQPAVGTNTTYSVAVSNSGPATSYDVVFTNSIPTGAAFVSASTTLGSCSYTNGTVTCILGDLTNGAAATATIVVQPASGGPQLDVAGVVALTTDTNAANNTAVDDRAALLGSTNTVLSLVYLPTSDLVFDPATQMIFASVPPNPQGWSNCVVGLNPQTGLTGSSFQVGDTPDQLGIARVGEDLYVGLDQNSTVQRINTVTGQLYPPFSIGLNTGYEAYSIDVMPGAPQTVAVANFYGAFGSTTIYDNGIPRPATVGAGFVEFSSDDSLLYVGGGDYFNVNEVVADGLKNIAQWFTGNVVTMGVDVANGTNYFPDGTVINTTTLAASRPFLGINENSFERLNPANNDIFFLFAGYTNWFLQRFDRASHALLNSLSITNIAGTPGNLILWGTNGLAFRTSASQIFLVQTSQIPPVPQLAVSQNVSPPIGTVGSNVTYTVVVTNSSSVAATDVQLTDTLPPGATFVSGNAPQGTFSQSQGVVTFSLGTLSNYSAVNLTIVAQPSSAGLNLNSNVVTADLYNLSSGWNISTNIQPVNTAGAFPETTEILDVPISEMVYDPANRAVLASVIGGPMSNSIVSIDVRSSLVTPVARLTNQPGVLALSDDSQYLYVGLTDGTGVDRINLSNSLIDLEFPLNAPSAQWQPYTAQNMSVMPGNHDAVAVALAGWGNYDSTVAIFDAGIEEKNAIFGNSEGGDYFDIAFSSSTAIPQDLRKSWNILFNPATRQG